WARMRSNMAPLLAAKRIQGNHRPPHVDSLRAERSDPDCAPVDCFVTLFLAMTAPVAPSSPLLFFDSGVGGLSVLAPTRALLPNAPDVYAADSAGFPYGQR